MVTFAQRVTTTGSFLRDHVQHGVVYAVGDTKQEALTKMYTQDVDLNFVPSRILHCMQDVHVFTDQNIKGYESIYEEQ